MSPQGGWQEGIDKLFQNSDIHSIPRLQSSPSIPGLQGTSEYRFFKGNVFPEAQDDPSSNSSMTTRELQEHWQKEKSRWKHVRLLFEIASARIEERKVSKFVVSRA